VNGRVPAPVTRRLIVVYRADPTRSYDWIPSPQVGDLTIALDGIAHEDLASRRALLFDDLESWEERSAAQHRIAGLLVAIGEHPAVVALARDGHPLIDFAELRLQLELARLLRGWTLACAGVGARELICDPAAPAALIMGARAGLGGDPSSISYEIPPAIPGSRLKRSLARPVMRALAARSKPDRVRIAAVVAGKLSLALTALPADELQAAGVGAMPFPGLDHGNGALLALRHRLPLLPTYGPRHRAGPSPSVRMPARLGLDEREPLDRAMTILVGRLLAGAATELEQAVVALAQLKRARSLRALVLPSAAIGASRLLIDWAHKRGLRVGAMQHGIYSFQKFDGGDRLADVIFGWGAATTEQVHAWPEPHPAVWTVGVPGIAIPVTRPLAKRLRRALIATSDTVDAPIASSAFCETFIDVLTPGLRRLAADGVKLKLRPHPSEDAGRYRRMLSARCLDVEIVAGGPFAPSAADADIVIASVSSVAFEAAAQNIPVLLWSGCAPQWVRREHLVPPWIEPAPGMFETPRDFAKLADGLVQRWGTTLDVACGLGRRLARYAEPFQPERFMGGLHALSA
jgi:hypothetical protein